MLDIAMAQRVNSGILTDICLIMLVIPLVLLLPDLVIRKDTQNVALKYINEEALMHCDFSFCMMTSLIRVKCQPENTMDTY